MTIFCPNCGNKNQDDAICCSNCGEALPHNDGRDDSKIQVTMPNLPDYENPDPVKEAEFAAALEAAGININFRQFMAIALNLAILASWVVYGLIARDVSPGLGVFIIIDGVGALFAMLLNSKLSFAITSFVSIIPFFIFCSDLKDGIVLVEGIILGICSAITAINAKK